MESQSSSANAPDTRRSPGPEVSTDSTRPVWVTVVDSEVEDAYEATTLWSQGQNAQWSVPSQASKGDLVLAWITGGVGFSYVLRIQSPPRAAKRSEFGPQQAELGWVATIDPAISMRTLKDVEALRNWWLVDRSMQGVVQSQRKSLTQDPEWAAFHQLLESIAPNAASVLPSPPTGKSRAADATPPAEPKQIESVLLMESGASTPTTATVTRDLASVLVRAAAINQKRDGFDLSFSSLLLGILYGEDPLARWVGDQFQRQGAKVEHALSKVGGDAAAARGNAARGMEERVAILQAPLRCTSSASRALEEASTIAGKQSNEPTDVTHLVAALITLVDYHDEDFDAMGFDRAQWGQDFFEFISGSLRDPVKTGLWWTFLTAAGINLPPLNLFERVDHRPDYDADAYTSVDLLAIEPEVAALAYVIAAHQTQPPLAIGLFGEWGSGKTFFMKHLRRRIEQLSAGAAEQRPFERVCHAHIAQIEFNAWHYQEGDLWASLVDHILRNLRFGEDEEEKKVSERRDQVLMELEATEARQKAAADQATQAEARVATAQGKVDQLKIDEEQRRKELAEQLTPGQILTAVRKGIGMDQGLQKRGKALAEDLGIPAVVDDAVELQQALSGAKNDLASVWAFLVPLFQAKDRRRRAILLGAAIVGPIVIGLALKTFLVMFLAQPGAFAWLGSAIAGVGSFLAAAASWINSQRAWVRQVGQRLISVGREVDAAVDDEIEARLATQKKAVAEKLAELETLRSDQARAQKERDEAAAEVTTLRTKLAVLAKDGLMRAFLDERIGGGVYQQKLGTAALVRRDFEQLSRKIYKSTNNELAGKPQEGDLVINRIVLYIDDLDRCEMNKVVPVLRAVHLLLAFPAFVVVVGVDSRWVARCLEAHHEDIFSDGEGDEGPRVTPLDYLEKIFQIPIWLEPVQPGDRVSMVRNLLRKPKLARKETGAVTTDRRQSDGSDNGQAARSKNNGQKTTTTPRIDDSDSNPPPTPVTDKADDQGGAPAPQPPVVDKEPEGPTLDLNPKGLEITDSEYAFLDEIGELLSPTPRAIKRFVNTYRLINVVQAREGAQDSTVQPSDSEIRMLLLAVLIQMPDLSRRLQAALWNIDGNDPRTLVEVMAGLRPMDLVAARASAKSTADEEYAKSRERAIREAMRSEQQATREWDVIQQWLEKHGVPWAKLPAARVARWLDPVGRYTFNLTRSALTRSTLPSTPSRTGSKRPNATA